MVLKKRKYSFVFTFLFWMSFNSIMLQQFNPKSEDFMFICITKNIQNKTREISIIRYVEGVWKERIYVYN